MSTNNIANTMTCNIRTIKKYLDGLIESFFLYKASRYNIKGKQYLKTGEKYYVSDLGLRYFILERKIGDYGHILENVVYLKILRRDYEVYVGKIDDYEVEFVVLNNNGRIYVQVAENLKGTDKSDTKILERELRSLKKINDNYEKIILTSDNTPYANEDGIKIYNVYVLVIRKINLGYFKFLGLLFMLYSYLRTVFQMKENDITHKKKLQMKFANF